MARFVDAQSRVDASWPPASVSAAACQRAMRRNGRHAATARLRLDEILEAHGGRRARAAPPTPTRSRGRVPSSTSIRWSSSPTQKWKSAKPPHKLHDARLAGRVARRASSRCRTYHIDPLKIDLHGRHADDVERVRRALPDPAGRGRPHDADGRDQRAVRARLGRRARGDAQASR